jgi:hypothetical protein
MNLLLALFFCHFLADYTWLSRPYMLAAKRFGKPFGPILAHAMVHAALMWLALVALGIEPGKATALGLMQLVTHAGIDWLKGHLNGRYAALQSPANVVHWVSFGLDQYAHTVVILLMWYATLLK